MHSSAFIESLDHDAFLDIMSILRAFEPASSKGRNVDKDISFEEYCPTMYFLIEDVAVGDDSLREDDCCSSCYLTEYGRIGKHVPFFTKLQMTIGLRVSQLKFSNKSVILILFS